MKSFFMTVLIERKTMTGQVENRPSGLPMVLGIICALLGGVLAVGAGVYVSHEAEPLWALIPVAWMISHVRDADDYDWQPLALGALMGILSLLIGGVALFLGQAGSLWALLLVVWLSDNFV
jgi:hypothetical protein